MMQKDEAIELCHRETGIIHRVKDDGMLMFYVSASGEHHLGNGKGVQQGYYTQMHNGNVRRFKGMRPKNGYEDWEPTAAGSKEHKVFLARKGNVPGPEAQGWTGAIGASPVNLAMRRTEDGLLMVRKSKDYTWLYTPHTGRMIRLRQGFRHYTGWEPVPDDHPLASLEWNQDQVPFRDSTFPPELIKNDLAQIDEWVKTGDCPALRAHREQVAQEIREHNRRVSPETIPLSEQLREKAELIRVAKANPPCLEVDTVIDEPAPEVLSNIGTMTEALASSIRSMVEIGENETAKELALQLKHLVGNASWLLRNDRTERAKQRVNGS